MKTIALLGEFTPTYEPHITTNAAIKHSGKALNVKIESEWISTNDVETSLLSNYAGLWVVPGSPYKDFPRTLRAIRYARENNIPCFGTCGGFQHMILEYVRHVLNFKDAEYAEYNPDASNLFISKLDCSLAGREMKLKFVAGSRVAQIYGALSATEQYYCNFGVNPEKVSLLTSGELAVTGSDDEGKVRVIELPSHPFFMGTLFVPQAGSTEATPHPLVTAFLASLE